MPLAGYSFQLALTSPVRPASQSPAAHTFAYITYRSSALLSTFKPNIRLTLTWWFQTLKASPAKIFFRLRTQTQIFVGTHMILRLPPTGNPFEKMDNFNSSMDQ